MNFEWKNITDDALIEEVRRRGFTIRDAQISPKREWAGLTDEDKESILDWSKADNWTTEQIMNVVENRLKERNT